MEQRNAERLPERVYESELVDLTDVPLAKLISGETAFAKSMRRVLAELPQSEEVGAGHGTSAS